MLRQIIPAHRKPNGASLNVWMEYNEFAVGDPVLHLHRQLMRKIENANDKYAAGQIDVAHWYMALARATMGALTFALESKNHEAQARS